MATFKIHTLFKQWFTLTVVAINVTIYAVIEFSGLSTTNPLTIVKVGGNFAPLTLDGQFWRLFTSTFLHFGIVHLVVNMYSLIFLGFESRKIAGNRRLAAVYFFCGIFASLTSVLFNNFTISVGASGAIFGLYGFVIIQTFVNPKIEAAEKRNVFINFILYLAFILLVGSQFQFDNAAHLGGLIAGLGCGAIFHLEARDAGFERNSYIFLFLVVLPLTYFFIPRFQVRYYKLFQQFLELDDKTIQAFNETSSDAQLKESLLLKIPRWDSLQKEIVSFRKVPAIVVPDTFNISLLSKLKVRQLKYVIKGIDHESYIYQDSVGAMGKRISELPKLQLPLDYRDLEKDSVNSSGRNKNLKPVKVYFDSDWIEIENENKAHFYRRGFKDSLDDWSGPALDFYISGAIQMKGYYNGGLKDGIFLYYTEDSTYSSAGRFSHNQEIGKWQSFYQDNQLKAEYRFTDRYRLILNTWDSLGNKKVANGNGSDTTRYDNGEIESAFSVKDGVVQGLSFGNYKSGKPWYREIFENGRLIKGISFSEDGTQTYNYDVSTYIVRPEISPDKFRSYLEENIRYPSQNADPLSGEVQLAFNVTEKGQVRDIVFLKRLGPGYDEEARRLLLEGPKWIPARIHGIKPVTSESRVVVSF